MYIKEGKLNYLKTLTESLNDRDEQLKKKDKFVQLVFDNCPAGLVIWAVDKNLVFTISEGKGLKNLGLKEGHSIGKSLYEYFDTVDDNFEPIKHHVKALNGESVKYDYEHLEGSTPIVLPYLMMMIMLLKSRELLTLQSM